MSNLRKKILVVWLIVLIIVPLIWSVTIGIDSSWWGDVPGRERFSNDIGMKWSMLHIFFNTVFWICWVIAIIHGISLLSSKSDLEKFKSYFNLSDSYSTSQPKSPVKYKKYIWLGSIALICIILYSKLISPVTSDCIKVYNLSTLYHNAYNQQVEEKLGFYDKMWKTYLQKEKITNINKETFIEVTKIIMENRADGQSITWKWLQENQNIPYTEFTKFYSDLTIFVETQREAYFAIEKTCQRIAYANNTLIDTFPNNMYNKLLHCKRIQFQYGFLSDKTNNVFKTKTENLK